jgi:hypothetical protein
MDGAEIDTTDATVIDLAPDDAGGEPAPRDYEADARAHGWTPKEEFKGDQSKWVDAETFAKRADEVMPFLKKQNSALKRELEDIKRTVKQAASFYEKAEERAYNRALADLEARHAAAVETGDVKAAKAAVDEMRGLEAEAKANKPEEPRKDDTADLRKISEWIETTEWYGPDEQRTKYADIVADQLGPALKYEGGVDGWLAELARRVDRKFAEKKPSPVASGGNRPSAAPGARSFNDLPAAAKAQCDRFIKQGVIKDRAQYVAGYDWN